MVGSCVFSDFSLLRIDFLVLSHRDFECLNYDAAVIVDHKMGPERIVIKGGMGHPLQMGKKKTGGYFTPKSAELWGPIFITGIEAHLVPILTGALLDFDCSAVASSKGRKPQPKVMWFKLPFCPTRGFLFDDLEDETRCVASNFA